PRAPVAEVVAARRGGHRLAAVDIPAGHGAALTVRIRRDRKDQVTACARGAAGEPRAPLVHAPAVVPKRADLSARPDVDLFPRALPHVRDVKVARLAIEREAPRIAQAVCDRLPRGA